MENIRVFLKNKNTCVIALIMFYGNNGVNPKKKSRLLSCVIYSLIENYFCIDYLSCQPKTLIIISSNRIFKQTSFNILIFIGIPELLLNIEYCHGFMKKANESVILNLCVRLVNNY